ncbi:MAG: MopE-related protein [Saprospiraceae bacterium]
MIQKLPSKTDRITCRYFLALFTALFFLAQSHLTAQVPELLYYRFDGTGTSVPNLATSPPSGTATATIIGDQTQGATGQCGGALIGTGSVSTSNFVNTGWAPDLGGNSWTLSLWINNVSNYSLLWYIFGDVNSNGFRCFTNGVAGADNFWLRGGGLTDVPVTGGAAAGPQIITFVYDNTLNNVKAYLNGTLVNTVAQGAVNLTGTGPLKVGGYGTNFGLAPGSRMDEFRLYNRALSASEVAAIAGNICLCYTDADGDGYGDEGAIGTEPVAGNCPMGSVSNNEDCNDNNENINPLGTEICDNLDNNCNGVVDDGNDLDGDGYSIAQGDCDDCDDAVNPGETELCGNGIDENCNGQIDEPLAVDPVVCGLFYGFSPFQDSVWTIDTANNYAITERRAPKLPGFTVTGVNGAAKNPLTGQIYAIAKVSGVSGRVLCIFNPADATMTQVGNLGDNFSSITFSPAGQLFGVTGDGASVPETLYEINPANASKTLLTGLGNGADGEVICYNPDDNMIYHWSGNSTVVYEKILPVPPYTVTGIPISGTTTGETFGAAYIGNNKFLISNISSSFNIITTTGTWGSAFGSTPDDIRGLPFAACDVTCYADADGDGYGDPGSPQVFQGTCGVGYVQNNQDCDDDDDDTYPCADEFCDGKDNDCNGQIDDGITSGGLWSNSNVGPANGSANFSLCADEPTDVFSVSATGFSTSSSDVLHAVYKQLCGNGEIIARVVSVTNGGWGGIMLRESLAQGSKKVTLKTQANGNIRREIRSVTNGASSNLNYFRPGHSWLRLVRTGSTFVGYTSTNGTTWTFAFSATVSMTGCIYAGLFSESINANVTTTAVFDNVFVTNPIVPLTTPGTTLVETAAPDLQVYPNPTNGELTVDLSAYGERAVRIELYDAQGKALKVLELDAAETTTQRFDLSAYPSGIYLIRATSEGIPDATKRVVLSSAERP